MFVRDHIPLEQGLRLRSGASTATIRRVRDHIPLEQSTILALCQRPYSIRTRIKT